MIIPWQWACIFQMTFKPTFFFFSFLFSFFDQNMFRKSHIFVAVNSFFFFVLICLSWNMKCLNVYAKTGSFWWNSINSNKSFWLIKIMALLLILLILFIEKRRKKIVFQALGRSTWYYKLSVRLEWSCPFLRFFWNT